MRYVSLRTIEKYETSPVTKKKGRKSSTKIHSNTAILSDESIVISNMPSPSDDLGFNNLSEEQTEHSQEPASPSTIHSFSKPSQLQSSIQIYSRFSQSSSSSPTVVNCSLPRPPPPILRISNTDNLVHSETNELTSNNPLQNDDLSMNNQNNQPIIDVPIRIDDENTIDVRRSGRTRTKKRRLYSTESISSETHSRTNENNSGRKNKRK